MVDGNIFSKSSFEQVCEFYKMYSEEHVRIDKENQLIYLTGNDVDTDKLIHEYMCLDFKNKTITFNNGKDEPYTIDGTLDENGKYVVVE